MPEPEQNAARVLLVEDDEVLRQSEERLLAKEGFQTVGVSAGAEALERLEREPYDLVLLDLDLKGKIDGLEICRKLKSQPHKAWMPVLFVTGQVRSGEVAKIFEAGGDEFVAKPFNSEELIVRAKVLVRKGREERWLVERARKLAEKVAERDDELDDLRRFAQDIVSSLPSALMVLDAEHRLLFANAPLLAWMEAERREVIGKPLAGYVRAEGLRGPVGQAIEAAMQSGQPARLRRVAGFLQGREDRISDVSVAAIEYAGERHVLVVIEDVTEQARAEAAVARERAKLDDIVNAMNAALCLVDRKGRILWQNRTFASWFGDRFGQPGLAKFSAQISEKDGALGAVFRKGRSQQKIWSVFTAHGHRRHFSNIIAPIQAESGQEISQALILTQDVTEQETRVEQLSLLRELSQFLQQTLDAERLNHLILLCVTAGHALGFNRAFLFKRNREQNALEAKMAVGPTSREDAFRIWAELSAHGRTLHELVSELNQLPPREEMSLYAQVKDLRYDLDDPTEIVVRTALEKKVQVVTNAEHDERVEEAFRRRFGAQEFVSVPMVAKGAVVGVILADNLYSGRSITDDHVKLLTLFASQAALAIENAETYAELQMRIAELRSTQEKMIHAEKLAAVGKMAAHVAHEIRNPMTTIGGFARAILKRPGNKERVTRNAGIIAEEAARLENMLKGVMDFSRPASPVLKAGDLNATVQKALRSHAEMLKSDHLTTAVDLDPSLPEVAHDEDQVIQVLANLIRNAVDAMPNGGCLSLETRRKGEMAVIRVKDTGTGISDEVKERMFGPFVTTKPDGTGLGLAMAKKIVDDHEGRMDCESQLGQGTVFSVLLPLRRSAPPLPQASRKA